MAWFKRREISDAEFVEKVRKGTLLAKKLAWAWLIYSIGYVALTVGVVTLISKHIEETQVLIERTDPVLDTSWSLPFASGVAAGLVIGGLGTLLLAKAVYCFWGFLDGWKGNRRSRLLVAYYDELQKVSPKPKGDSDQ